MDTSIITFRSVTPAQRGESALRKGGIGCSLQRTPRHLAEKGCGYSLRLRRSQLPGAVELLRQAGIAYQKTYHIIHQETEEVQL